MKNKIISLFMALHILTTGIVLSACSNGKDEFVSDDTTVATEAVAETEVPTELEEDVISPELLTTLKAIIDEVEPVYKNSDYYPNMDLIKEYKKLADTSVKCPEEDTDYYQVYDAIKENTIERYGKDGVFIVPGARYDDVFSYDDVLEKADINNDFTYAIFQALGNIFCHATNNVEEDICSLKNIAIINKDLSSDNGIFDTSSVLGTFDDENFVVSIDYAGVVKYIDIANEVRRKNDEDEISLRDFLTNIIEHEFNHVRQFPCKHRIENGDKEKSIFYDYNNPSFVIESSAESALYNYNGYRYKNLENSDYTYKSYRELEALMMLLAAFKENSDINGYYEAVFDSDIKALWNYFGLDTDEKLVNFNKILYAFNTLACRSELVKDTVGEGNSITYGELKDLAGDAYLVDMMKFVSKDLIDATERDELSLDNSLLLYSFVKSALVSEASDYVKLDDDSYEHQYNEEFVLNIRKIDDAYSNYLCSKFNITSNDLQEKIDNSDLPLDIVDFMSYLKGDDEDISYENKSRFYYLLNKYPILSNIMFAKYFLVEYDDFNEYADKIMDTYKKTYRKGYTM